MRILRFFQVALIAALMLMPMTVTAQEVFDPVKFNEIATRAESVMETGLAASDALEEMRITLSDARSRALDAQMERGARVKTLREQVTALGPLPADGTPENADIAQRRKELNDQLAVASQPMLVSLEAYERANGLILEIDSTIRARKAAALVKREATPLNPVAWGQAVTALSDYVVRINSEVRDSLNSPATTILLKQKLPLVLFLVAVGLIFLIPVSRWINRKMAYLDVQEKSVVRGIKGLVLSLLVFGVPVLGFLLLVNAISSLNILGLRGSLLLKALPAVSVAFFGANWLARNLFSTTDSAGADTAADPSNLKQRRMKGTYNYTLILGGVVGVGILIDALAASGEFSVVNLGVLRFPLIIVGGYVLVLVGRKTQDYRKRMAADGVIAPMADRCLQLLAYLCFAAGGLGPLAAALGYFNIGSLLVNSTALTLAVLAAFYVLFNLIVVFTEDALPISDADETGGPVPQTGLFRVFLAFGIACLSLPFLALIWGARVSDLQNVWLMLSEGVQLGDTRLSFSDLLTFALVFSIGYTVTRLLQSGLRTAVLPKTKIDLGAQNALVTGLGYVGLFLAAAAAITSTGLDLSSLAIVAGALSVGIGFGLQNIVSNFVSGIILLIERPIRLGDWIEVGTISGYVSKISVRSTTIETFEHSEVIVPNADFISGTVTNMTHNNKRGRIKVPVGVAYDSDPEQVKEILLSVANDNPTVLKLPAPKVYLLRFGADSIDFEIRGILRDVGNIISTHSDINFEILRRFNEAKIEIPFGQREIRIKNAGEFAQALQPKKTRKT
tara:strand:- start:6712 stop:9078 length:2367 start_codon:yes stop_codon:yes gene_type:complete